MRKFKFRKITALVLVFSMMIGMSGSVFAEKSETYDVEFDSLSSTIIVAEFSEEVNGDLYYTAIIPFNDVSTDEKLRASDHGDVVAIYHQSGLWEVQIIVTALDLIKYLNGTCSTYGAWGTDSNTYTGQNFIPAGVITADTIFSLNPSMSYGSQFFKVTGAVTGVAGGMSFGPTIVSVEVPPYRQAA